MTAERTTGFTDINRQHWSLRYLPPWARPYGRLARWDRPIGIWLLMLPCWWSAALGAAPEWGRLVGWMALFALGALAMRGAGCTWNDIVDRKVDAQVERTRSRPLPAGEVKLRNALIWMVLQSAVGAAILFKLNKFAGGVALLLAGPGRHLSDDEALHLLAAGRARARLQLGRAGGLRRADRDALLGDRRALCRRRRLDHGLRHDLRHAGPARRRHHRRGLDGPPLCRRATALAHPVRRAGAVGLGAGGLPCRPRPLLFRPPAGDRPALRLADRAAEAARSGRLPRQVQGQCLARRAADGRRHRGHCDEQLRPHCHPERSEGPFRRRQRSLAALG